MESVDGWPMAIPIPRHFGGQGPKPVAAFGRDRATGNLLLRGRMSQSWADALTGRRILSPAADQLLGELSGGNWIGRWYAFVAPALEVARPWVLGFAPSPDLHNELLIPVH